MKYPIDRAYLADFLAESNAIEGITGPITKHHLESARAFLDLTLVKPVDVELVQAIIAPNRPLRIKKGMDVRVGNHRPPAGGPGIGTRLGQLLYSVEHKVDSPWAHHIKYETIHPFMDGNGRTGRLLWLWEHSERQDPDGHIQLGRGFLHSFYYETLTYTRLSGSK